MQAVSQLVEGNEPRKKWMGRTMLLLRRKATWVLLRWPGHARFRMSRCGRLEWTPNMLSSNDFRFLYSLGRP